MTLRSARLACGYSQAELSTWSGVEILTLRRLEAGLCRALYKTRRRLLLALNIPFDRHIEIFGDLPRTPSGLVATLRREQGLTQAQLAKKAGVALRTLWSAEHGKPVRMDVRRKLLGVLGVEMKAHREIFGRLPWERA